MTNKFLYFLLFTNFYLLDAQSGSYLYAIPDSITPQGFTLSLHNDRIFALNSTFQLGVYTGLNLVPYLEEYALDGKKLKRIQVDPMLPQGYTVINNLPILWVEDKVLISADKSPIDIDEPQHAVVWGLNEDGENEWEQGFIANNYLGTSGILLPFQNNQRAFHANIRNVQDANMADIEINLINSNGNIELNSLIGLPLTQQREYIRVMGGASLKDKMIVLSIYGSINGGNTKSVLTFIDTTGNLIEHKDIVGTPLIASWPQSDTFYLASYKSAGGLEYYCLKTYAGSISNLVSTKCSENSSSTTSDFTRNMRVNSEGNVFILGASVLQNGSNRVAHLSKWSSDGNLLWKKNYKLSDFMAQNVEFSDIGFLSNGNLVLSGYASNYEWLLLLDENGCFEGDCSDLITLPSSIVSTKEHQDLEKNKLNIYPNPANNEITIECPFDGNLRLYDSQGILQKIDYKLKGTSSLSLKNYPEGIYFLQLTDEGNAKQILGKISINRSN
jgi:Secretion system C-terminal sorting domain